MKEIILTLLLVVIVVISLLLHYRKVSKNRLATPGVRHLRPLITADNSLGITPYLPEKLRQLYEDDLQAVSNSARHTLIACNLIIQEIGDQYYKNQQLTTIELANKLLTDRWITQDMFVWATDFEKITGDLLIIEKKNMSNNANAFKNFTCFLLQMLYVTPNQIMGIRKN